jgi:hypothetical protein
VSRSRVERWITGVAVMLVLLGATKLGRAVDRDARATLRVLFIGNSYTRFNNLPRLVASLSESVAQGPIVRAKRETHGGFNLRRHWRRRRVRDRIARGGFDAIVIQGHSLSPIRDPGEMAEYARRFSQRARAVGARLILFETWARAPRSRVYRRYELAGPAEMLARVDSVYAQLGHDLGASVSPVGRAFARAADEASGVRLRRRDRTHPTLAGSYLAACVLYGTLTGNDPREASYVPWPLSQASASTLRAIAAETLAR